MGERPVQIRFFVVFIQRISFFVKTPASPLVDVHTTNRAPIDRFKCSGRHGTMSSKYGMFVSPVLRVSIY